MARGFFHLWRISMGEFFNDFLMAITFGIYFVGLWGLISEDNE